MPISYNLYLVTTLKLLLRLPRRLVMNNQHWTEFYTKQRSKSFSDIDMDSYYVRCYYLFKQKVPHHTLRFKSKENRISPRKKEKIRSDVIKSYLLISFFTLAMWSTCLLLIHRLWNSTNTWTEQDSTGSIYAIKYYHWKSNFLKKNE